MKKILAALLVASFGAGLMAQGLVYDYKASIKRLDAQFSIKKIKKDQFVASSYKVVSDTISGYIVLPICVSCNVLGVQATALNVTAPAVLNPVGYDNFNGYAFLTRTGDKLSKKSGVNKPYVLVTEVEADAGIFGAYINLKKAEGADGTAGDITPQADVRAANKAWMGLDIYFPSDHTSISSEYIIPENKASKTNIYLGFLGLTNAGMKLDGDGPDVKKVAHTGFGAVKVQKWHDAAELGWCFEGEDRDTSCQYVSSISGTLVGYPTYQGPCGATPIWDVCYPSPRVANVNEAVISGTWTLKYNNTVTVGYNAKYKTVSDAAYTKYNNKYDAQIKAGKKEAEAAKDALQEVRDYMESAEGKALLTTAKNNGEKYIFSKILKVKEDKVDVAKTKIDGIYNTKSSNP